MAAAGAVVQAVTTQVVRKGKWVVGKEQTTENPPPLSGGESLRRQEQPLMIRLRKNDTLDYIIYVHFYVVTNWKLVG